MKTIPLIFTFDKNMSFPASVCLSSILMSANEDTFYDIFVLYSGEVPPISDIDKIKSAYPNFNLRFRNVGHVFDGAFEIRGITTAAYYRLLAADLIPEYDKAVYADVDMIFRSDLSRVYDLDLKDNYFGSVYTINLCTSNDGRKYIASLGGDPDTYFQSGFLLMNLKQLREDHMSAKFVALAKNKFKYQDMDIINIACRGRIMPISWIESMADCNFYHLETNPDIYKTKYADTDAETARLKSNIHYNGQKPWNGLCPNFDIWWEYYRKSPVFNPERYFKFFYNNLEPLEHLPLKKRVKLLVRYFIYGQKKDI